MPLLTETFGLHTNNTLTAVYSGTNSLIHFTDESDNPQNTQLWFGSLGSGGANTADRECSALSDPGVDDVVLSVVDILPFWDNATAYVVGDVVQAAGSVTNFRFKCTVAGTSGGSEPVFNPGIGSTTTDNTVTWTLQSAKHETTEIKLSLTEGGLTGATPGASLVISGTSVVSGTSNKVEIWVGVSNSINTVMDNTAVPDLALRINDLIESEVP